MYDNSSLALRCRTLWSEILSAVESRVWSINDYMNDSRTQLDCQLLSSESVLIQQPTTKRTLIASLDLVDHAIEVQQFDDGKEGPTDRLPFAMLGDGNIYVTAGKSLMGDPMAVARQLMSVLLATADETISATRTEEFRAWAAALITARAPRREVRVPIEIRTEATTHQASTIDLSSVGMKVESSAPLDRGNYVTIFRGSVGSFFRVVWSEKTEAGSRAGLVCLNPPLDWAELAG